MTLAATAPPPVFAIDFTRTDLPHDARWALVEDHGLTALVLDVDLGRDQTAAAIAEAFGGKGPNRITRERAAELADALTRIDGCDACRKRPIATVVALDGVDFRLCRSCGADHRALTAA